MRIHNEETELFIHDLAESIARDPLSFEAWNCVRIVPQHGMKWDNELINSVKESQSHIDCEIIICDDMEILIIGRSITLGVLLEVAESISANMELNPPEFINYNVTANWAELRSSLLGKITSNHPKIQLLEEGNFGEIESLLEAFNASKNLRKARQPQYVMLVEDDHLTKRMVSNILKENYALVTAGNAAEAVAIYLMYAPDIVFLDIGLPDASGFAVLKQIMRTDPEAYVVMFSGNSYIDNITKALNAGASGFVPKPFKKERLNHYIQSSVAHHRKIA